MYSFEQYHMGEALILYGTQLLDFVIVKTISLNLINDTDLRNLVIYFYAKIKYFKYEKYYLKIFHTCSLNNNT